MRDTDWSIYSFSLGGSGWDLVDFVGWPRWTHSLWEPPDFTAPTYWAPRLVG